MNEKFENEISKCIDSSLTALEIKLSRHLRKYCDSDDRLKVGKPLKYLFYSPNSGLIELKFKYQYSPEDIQLLDSIKMLPKEKLSILQEYIAQLSNAD